MDVNNFHLFRNLKVAATAPNHNYDTVSQGSRLTYWNMKGIPSPLMGEGEGGGDLGDYFTASGRGRSQGELGMLDDNYLMLPVITHKQALRAD
jgi:hypothetical protein